MSREDLSPNSERKILLKFMSLSNYFFYFVYYYTLILYKAGAKLQIFGELKEY